MLSYFIVFRAVFFFLYVEYSIIYITAPPLSSRRGARSISKSGRLHNTEASPNTSIKTETTEDNSKIDAAVPDKDAIIFQKDEEIKELKVCIN